MRTIFIFLFAFLLFFSSSLFSQSVHNRTTGSNYTSITNALIDAVNGDLIEIDPGTYNESLTISGFTNLTLRATAWTQSGDN
ncbi:MAG: hypothetical protein JW827_00385, partial [Spirochaetes bacterium]|nr:hypothetical protein [Spirochaetota bacterium]